MNDFGYYMHFPFLQTSEKVTIMQLVEVLILLKYCKAIAQIKMHGTMCDVQQVIEIYQSKIYMQR